MKIIHLYIILLGSFSTLAQNISSNRWSVDMFLGGTNAVKPYSEGYWSNTIGFMHTSIGSRYMFNNKFGLKLDGGYDRIKNDESSIFFKNGSSLPFQSNYYRFSLQGVADVGRLLTFENFTDKYSMLFHAGGGISVLTSKINPSKDRMVNIMFGVTPQYKINKRMSLNIDASFIWHIYQQYTFDMHNPVYKRGFDGFIANATVGLNIYIGKHQEHNDWTYSPCYPDLSYLQVENKKLDSVNNKLNKSLMDSDDDGILNAIDEEDDTPIGEKVNCSGVSLRNIDSDKDGISDLIDKCIDIPGEIDFEGCPKKVYEALLDSKDDTSDSTNIAKNNIDSNNQDNKSNGNNSIENNNNNNNSNGQNNHANNSNIANNNGANNNNTNSSNSNGQNNSDNNSNIANNNGANNNNTNGSNSNGQNTNGNNSNVANNNSNNSNVSNNNNGKNNNTNGNNSNGQNTNGNNSNVTNNNGTTNNNSNVNNSNGLNNNGKNNNSNSNNSNAQNNNGNNSNVANNSQSNNNSNGNNTNAPVLLNKEGFSSLSDVNFELNQSGVNQSFNSVLNEIISLLKSNPNSVLALEGHTDATGETNFNNELSLKRANALKAYFVSKGIDPNRIQVGSFGESKPKYLNKTPTGRALNRRVEIYIKE